MKQPTNIEIEKIRKALPSGAIQRISDKTGQEYQLVYRTLQGLIKRWDQRHQSVIDEALNQLKNAGIKLV